MSCSFFVLLVRVNSFRCDVFYYSSYVLDLVNSSMCHSFILSIRSSIHAVDYSFMLSNTRSIDVGFRRYDTNQLEFF